MKLVIQQKPKKLLFLQQIKRHNPTTEKNYRILMELDQTFMVPGLVYKFDLWPLIVPFSDIVPTKLIEGGKPGQLQRKDWQH
jgi:hypothetical protein